MDCPDLRVLEERAVFWVEEASKDADSDAVSSDLGREFNYRKGWSGNLVTERGGMYL